METPPDPGDTKDFRFEKLQEILSWAPEREAIFSKVIRGLAVANRFGLAFCVCDRGFYAVDCAGPLVTGQGRSGARLEDVGAFIVPLQRQPILIATSSSGLTLAVCFVGDDGVPNAFFYDIRAFSRKSAATNPFHIIRLSNTPGVSIRDFSWIPTNEEIFAVVLSDGSLSLFEIKDSATNIMGSLPPTVAATCISWSPKGKQFVVGKADGSLAQYKPDLTVARNIPGPKGVTLSARNVVWLSTYVFAVAYVHPSDPQPILVVLNSPKSGDPVFTNFSDVCMGSSDAKRQPFYHMLPIFEWNMLLVASNTGMELAVLSCQSADQTTGWLQLMMEETGRAEMPLVGSEENFPLGISLLTCAPFPAVLAATSLGVVVVFRIVNVLKGPSGPMPSLCSKPEPLVSVPGERRQLDIPAPVQPVTTTAPVPEKKPLFAHPVSSEPVSAVKSPLIQSTNQSVKSSKTPSQPSVSLASPSNLESLLDTKPSVEPASPSVLKPTTPVAFAGLKANAQEIPKTVPKFVPDAEQTVSTRIISNRGISAAQPTSKVSTGPAKIPSGTVQEFLRKVAVVGKQAEKLLIESNPQQDAELSLRMESLSNVMENLMAMFTDMTIKLNEHERVLEERIHVAEEALVIIEQCNDAQFLTCFRALPLDPLHQRKYDNLNKNLKEMELKLRSMNIGIDIELDTMESKTANVEDQFGVAKKSLKELETKTLELQRKMLEVEKEAKKFGVQRKSLRSSDSESSPAETISRLYPDLTKLSSSKLSTAATARIRSNVKNSPLRTTKHEIMLLRRHITPENVPSPARTAKPSFKLDADFSGFDVRSAGSGSATPLKVSTSVKVDMTGAPAENKEKALPVGFSIGSSAPTTTKTSSMAPASTKPMGSFVKEGSTTPNSTATFSLSPSFGFGSFGSSGKLTEISNNEKQNVPLVPQSTSVFGESPSKPQQKPAGSSASVFTESVGKQAEPNIFAKAVFGDKPAVSSGSVKPIFGLGTPSATSPRDASKATPPAGGSFSFGSQEKSRDALGSGSSSVNKSDSSEPSDEEGKSPRFGYKSPEISSAQKLNESLSFGFGGFGGSSSLVTSMFMGSPNTKSTVKIAVVEDEKPAANEKSPVVISTKEKPSLFGEAPKIAPSMEATAKSPESKPTFIGFHKSGEVPKSASPEIPQPSAQIKPALTESKPVFGFGAPSQPPVSASAATTEVKVSSVPTGTASSAKVPGFGSGTSPFSFRVDTANAASAKPASPFGAGSFSAFGSLPAASPAGDSAKPIFGPPPTATGDKTATGIPPSVAGNSPVSSANTTTPSKAPLFGAASFSAFGSTPAAPLPASDANKAHFGTPPAIEKSAFGATPAAEKPVEIVKPQALPAGDAFKSAFGSSGFGANSAFGSGGFGSKPAEAKDAGGFGSVGFGVLTLGSSPTPQQSMEPIKNPFAVPGLGNSTTQSGPSTGFGSAWGGGTMTSTFPSSSSTFPAPSAAEPARPVWGAQPQPAGFGGFRVDTPGFGSGGFGAAPNPFAAQAAARGFPSPAGFGAPAFGQTPAFGTATGAFGSSPSFGAPVQQSSSAIWNQPGGFAAYAQAPGLSFGSVAAQNPQPGGFGAVAQQQQPQQQQSGFGFGGGNAPAPSNAFTQYR